MQRQWMDFCDKSETKAERHIVELPCAVEHAPEYDMRPIRVLDGKLYRRLDIKALPQRQETGFEVQLGAS